MQTDSLIAALERAAKLNDQCVANIGQKSSIIGNCYKRDAALIRQHIADLRAGNLVRRDDVVALNGDFACAVAYDSGHTAGATQERAKVVAYLRRVGLTPKARDLFATAAGHIAAGAHEGDDAPA